MLKCLAVRLVLAAGLVVTMAWPLSAQRFGFGGRGRDNDLSVLWGMPDLPGGFTFCRLMYTSVRSGTSGSGWAIEYPRAEMNLMTRLSQLTAVNISRWLDGEPGYTVVRAGDPELFSCPFVMMASPGQVGFSAEEVAALREYLLKGGFLWADDFWGEASWRYWEQEITRVLPELPIVELGPDHALFRVHYQIAEFPQIPALNSWRPGMSTSELGRDSETPHLRAMVDGDGRILVLMSHNTDIADGWEREADLDAYFHEFSAKAYAVGVNVVLYTMSR